jgi:hypothetical protein
MFADLLGRVAVLLIEADDEIELLFLLHHFGGDIAADGGLDQRVDVVDVEAVARDLGAVDLDVEAGLAEFLHQGHVADAAHMLQDFLDRLALCLKRVRDREPKTLTASALFKPDSASSTASSAGWV